MPNNSMQPKNGFRLTSITGAEHPATPSNLRGFYMKGALHLSVEPIGHKIWPIDFKLEPKDREILRYEAAYVHGGFKMNDVVLYDKHLNLTMTPKFYNMEDGYFLLIFSFTSKLGTEEYSAILTPDDFETFVKLI